MTTSHSELFDVLIVGAGVSGIGVACTLRQQCPEKRFVILESRDRLGGTWDLFKYPGVRSDSDMHTYAYGFRPWQHSSTLALGSTIQEYLSRTAADFGVDQLIRYGHRIERAEWSSDLQVWTLSVRVVGQQALDLWRCRFLILGTGYYSYEQGYSPEFPGVESFAGLVIHPQQWPDGLDCAGKRVVVIGSGATAATMVPALVQAGAQVTMLQRSPSYYLAVPAHDGLTEALGKIIPQSWAFAIARRRNILVSHWLYRASRRWPGKVRQFLLKQTRKRLPPEVGMEHFTPRYQPWDQRLCVIPEGDLLASLKSGGARIVTDQVTEFAADHIKLRSGAMIEADIVVTATGLQLQNFGGIDVVVDGQGYSASTQMLYKSVLMQDLPNFAWILGYINASWTLKVDIAAQFLCRLFKRMSDTNTAVVVASAAPGMMLDQPVMGELSAGYVQRAFADAPRQGREAPWRVSHNYMEDKATLLQQPLEDGVLQWLGPNKGL